MHPRLCIVLATTCLIPACGHDANGSYAAAPDTTGVPVVVNGLAGADWDTVVHDLDVEASIGVVDGDENYLFDRINNVDVSSDGTIYVSNVGSQQIKAYDSTGRFIRALGGEGEGPGEFTSLMWVWAHGDTVIASAMDDNRYTVFDGEGKARTAAIFKGREEWMILVKPLAEGWAGEMRQMTGADEDWAVNLRKLWIIDPKSRKAKRLLYDLGEESVVTGLFQRRGWVDITSSNVFATTQGDPYTITVHALDGKVVRRISRDIEPLRVDQGWRKEIEDRIGLWSRTPMPRNVTTDEKRIIAKLNSQWPADDNATVHPIGSIHAGDDGSIWVERFDLAPGMVDAAVDHLGLGDSAARTPASLWDVFDNNGRLLGTVRLPEGFKLHVVHGRSATGVLEDELNVETVVRLRIPASLTK